jgi:hypothetical protein
VFNDGESCQQQQQHQHQHQSLFETDALATLTHWRKWCARAWPCSLSPIHKQHDRIVHPAVAPGL